MRRRLPPFPPPAEQGAKNMSAFDCVRCGRQLTATEPVWRKQTTRGRGFFGGTRWTVALFCEPCAPLSDYRYWSAKPCEGCARVVHNVIDGRRRRHTYCCEGCELRQRQALMRQRRAEARGATKVCACCGETFEPVRADAVFCSGVCRQKAYRRRVTDRKCRDAETITNRNAEAVSPDRVTDRKCDSVVPNC